MFPFWTRIIKSQQAEPAIYQDPERDTKRRKLPALLPPNTLWFQGNGSCDIKGFGTLPLIFTTSKFFIYENVNLVKNIPSLFPLSWYLVLYFFWFSNFWGPWGCKESFLQKDHVLDENWRRQGSPVTTYYGAVKILTFCAVLSQMLVYKP